MRSIKHMLTKTQINKIKKAIVIQKGVNIYISKTQIRKVIKRGGSLFSALFGKLLPLVTKHVLPWLALGTTTGLAYNVVGQIFGRGYSVPYIKLPQLYEYAELLTPRQKVDLTRSLKTGSVLQITPARTQSGGFLGTLLASIGIPMVLKALTGGGMQIEPYRGSGMQIEPYRGGSKKKHDEVSIRKEINHRQLLKPQFKFEPISNIDIIEWLKYFKVKNFNGVYSRDNIGKYKTGFYILNMDDVEGGGTHWVAMNVRSNIIDYFDSFGMPPLKEIVDKKFKYQYNNIQYQSNNSVLCGYWAIYFINEGSKRKPYYEILQPLSITNTKFNENFLINYFT